MRPAADLPGTIGRSSTTALIVLGVLAGIQGLDPSVANVALVEAAKDFGLGADGQALAASVSTLMLAATVTATGSLGDRLGRRRVLVAALPLAVVGNVIVALSPALWAYLTGRAIVGVGLGAVFACAFGMLKSVAPPERMGAALGTWIGVTWIAMLAGTLAGGLLNDLDWRLAFLLVPAISLAMVPVVLRTLPETDPAAEGRFDVIGLSCLAVGMVGLLFGLSRASSSLSSPTTWGPVLLGIAGLIAFALVESRSSHPAFPIRLLRSPVFVAAVVAGLLWNFANAILLLQTSNLWQYLYFEEAFAVTLGQLPFTIAAAIASFLVGRALTRGSSPRTLMVAGSLVLAAGFGVLTFAGSSSPYLLFLPAFLLVGVGVMLVQTPQAQLFVSAAPARFLGAVTSSRTAVGQLGYAFGLAGGTALVGNLTRAGFTSDLKDAGVPPTQFGGALDEVHTVVLTHDTPATQQAREIVSGAASSYVSAFGTTMLAASLLCLGAAGAIALLMRGAQTSDATARASDPLPATGRP